VSISSTLNLPFLGSTFHVPVGTCAQREDYHFLYRGRFWCFWVAPDSGSYNTPSPPLMLSSAPCSMLRSLRTPLLFAIPVLQQLLQHLILLLRLDLTHISFHSKPHSESSWLSLHLGIFGSPCSFKVPAYDLGFYSCCRVFTPLLSDLFLSILVELRTPSDLFTPPPRPLSSICSLVLASPSASRTSLLRLCISLFLVLLHHFPAFFRSYSGTSGLFQWPPRILLLLHFMLRIFGVSLDLCQSFPPLFQSTASLSEVSLWTSTCSPDLRTFP
jgi:hypothetical protein